MQRDRRRIVDPKTGMCSDGAAGPLQTLPGPGQGWSFCQHPLPSHLVRVQTCTIALISASSAITQAAHYDCQWAWTLKSARCKAVACLELWGSIARKRPTRPWIQILGAWQLNSSLSLTLHMICIFS